MLEPNQVVRTFQEQNPIQMQPDEIETILATIRAMPEEGIMIEWGSGASTIRWLQEMHGRQRLISIEHNALWFNKVKNVIDTDPDLAQRLTYHMCASNGFFDHGYGMPSEENPLGLDEYFNPDPTIYDADVFLIDGVARGTCAQMVLMKASKANPVIYLHDWYTRRGWYSWSVGLFRQHKRAGDTLCRLWR
ncbi:hypothetical protein [Methylobacterium sp. SyP6R]|uniref:hypothetical protein n=1 Tax=Methylobacterium sp. SyP6R TaxID=2718876 RepID=UPI001F22872C|nr:hypothetical protein [Methylobacterium sp. SyP6R]MCF4127010.1 hypothetical protein [Methylobacterium sp. SyP6R]